MRDILVVLVLGLLFAIVLIWATVAAAIVFMEWSDKRDARRREASGGPRG